MDNRFHSSNGYINRGLRAKANDYALFYAQLERIVALKNEGNKFKDIYGLFYTTLRSFPEIIKFFVTGDFTIVRESGLSFDSDDVVYFRSFALKYPDILSFARTLLGRLYMSRDVGFYSEKDQVRANKFRTVLFPAHVNFPEMNWHGYPPPNTYNLSEAVYFFEQAIIGGVSYFQNSVTLYAALKSGAVTNIYLTSFLIACMKLEFLNILPCNTVEYIATKKTVTFSDIVEDVLRSLELLQPGVSRDITIGGIPIRVALQQAKTRRLLQNYNIQNIALGRDSPDSERLSQGVGVEIATISERSQSLSGQIGKELVRIFSQRPNLSEGGSHE